MLYLNFSDTQAGARGGSVSYEDGFEGGICEIGDSTLFWRMGWAGLR